MGRGGNLGSGSSEKRGHRGKSEKRMRSRDDGAGAGDGDEGKSHRADVFDGPVEAQDAARKMRAKMKEQAMAGGGAGEFNIG